MPIKVKRSDEPQKSAGSALTRLLTAATEYIECLESSARQDNWSSITSQDIARAKGKWLATKSIENLVASKEIERFRELYVALNEMLAILGADGEVNTRQMTVINVMEALAEIDGGEFDTAKVFGS